MTTFTAPVRTKLLDGYNTPVSASGYNNESFLGNGMGYIPQVFPFNYTYADYQTITNANKAVVIPAGSVIHAIEADVKDAFTGASVGTCTLNIGTGANFTTLFTGVNIAQQGRKTYNVSAGTSIYGAVLTADTTLNFQVSVSGATTTTGFVSAGSMTVNVILG